MNHFSSLKSTIVFRLIIPIMIFIILIECTFSFFVTRHNVAETYDRWLLNSARSLEQEVKLIEAKISVKLSDSALKIFKWDDVGSTYFNIQTENGNILVGDLPLMTVSQSSDQKTKLFSNILLNGENLRLVSLKVSGELPEAVFINVAETLDRRRERFLEMLVMDLAPQLFLTLIIGALLYKGVDRVLKPLHKLTHDIAQRSPSDLSPIPEDGVFKEVVILTDTINYLFAKLSDAINSQQRFIANAAHQLRTPLAGLKLQAERAQREQNIETMRPALVQIQHSADSISHLINQLLVLARSDQLETRHAFQKLDLLALTKNICMEWVPRALEKEITLSFESLETAVYINGDSILLTELLSNLLDNAIKYGHQQGNIQVTISNSSRPCLLLEDDGPGISEAESEKVFERFYRTPGSSAKGCGLGLAIVKEIADLHFIELKLSQSSMGGVCFALDFNAPWMK